MMLFRLLKLQVTTTHEIVQIEPRANIGGWEDNNNKSIQILPTDY